jgi:hypothetical protein
MIRRNEVHHAICRSIASQSDLRPIPSTVKSQTTDGCSEETELRLPRDSLFLQDAVTFYEFTRTSQQIRVALLAMPQGGSIYAASHGGQATKWRVGWCLAFAGVDASPDQIPSEPYRDTRVRTCPHSQG